MPIQNRRVRRTSNKRGSKNPVVISSVQAARSSFSAPKLMYNGGISIPRSRFQEDIMVTNLFYITNLTSSSGGIIQNVFTNDPSNTLEWSFFQAVYEEYRVLGFELEFFPTNRYSKPAGTLCTPGVSVVDHGNTAPLASLAAGFQHASCRMMSIEDPWTSRRDFAGNKAPSVIFKMASAEEAVFNPISVILSNAAIKLYFNLLSNTSVYGLILLKFLVQFRGRA